MPSITDKFGKASIDNNYAVATTVKTTRTAGVTVLEAFDLSKYNPDTPVFFVTYKKTTDPVTGDVSVIDLVSWKGLVNTGANTLTNLTLAPGYTDLGNDVGDFIECIPTSFWVNSMMDGIFVGHNPDGSFKVAALKAALGNDGNLVQSLDDVLGDFVLSGGVWSLLSGLNGQMTAMTAYINGYKNTLAAVATRAFTLSKDTYVDVLHNTTTNVFSLVYSEVANGAAAPALAADSIRIAKVVTNGSTITSVSRTGQDSLNNQLYPTRPSVPKVTHIRVQMSANIVNPATGLTIPFNNKQYDVLGEWDTGTYRFVATQPGLYDIRAQIAWGSAGSGSTEAAEIGIRKNGTQIMGSPRQAGNGTGSQLNRPLGLISTYLEAGDYIDVVNNSTNGVRDISANYYSYIEIHRQA